MKRFLLLLLTAVGITAAGAAEFAKAHNYRIVIPDKATGIEKSAAAELKLHLGKSYTKPVKLNGKTPKLITFFVGSSKEAAAAGFGNCKYKGEFLIARKGDNFFFTGPDTPKGTLMKVLDLCGTFQSVSYFAQKYMQVKIFMPGNEGIKYASDPEIKFTAAQDSPVPSYGVRGFQSAGKGVKGPEALLYFKRRLGRVPSWTKFNYYYKFLNNWNKRFKDRPELFALHEGKRVNENYPRHFPCTSNPAVLDQMEKDIAETLKKRPSIYAIRFFSDAPVRSCECSNCRNSKVGKLVTPSDHSETVYALFCQAAKRALKYKKGLYFHIQTKGTVYCKVPRTEKLPPNTVISVLTGHFLPQDFNYMRNLCASWRKAGARVLIYSYPRAPEMKDYPLMNPHRIAEYYKNFKGAAEGSNIAEGRSKVPYSFSALNTYIHSALMFDTSLDTDKLIDEFCTLAAPKCSKELKSFYTAMEKLLEGAGFRDDPRYNCYALPRLKAPRALLGKALAKDPSNKFLKQLTADFDNFIKVVSKTGVSVQKYHEALKAHDAAAAKRKLVDMRPGKKAVEFPFVPFVPFDEFQTGTVKMTPAKEKFVFTARCREKQMAHLQTLCKKNHEGMIWSDDVVEIFIGSPAGMYPYIHMAVNAKGVYRVQLNTEPKKAVELKGFKCSTRGSAGKDEWSVDVTIPLKELQKVIKEGKAKVGFCRSRAISGKRKGQYSAIQRPAKGGFHSDEARFMVQFR